jgi:hypothetical protein
MSVLVELFAAAPVAPVDLAPHRLDLEERLDGAPSVDLGVSWQAVERALAACDPVWEGVFESGTAIDSETRYLSPERVKALGAALDAVDPARWKGSVLDLLAASGELYGGPWGPTESALLVATVERFTTFWRAAAARGDALFVVWG